jgi:hypothetical protein
VCAILAREFAARPFIRSLLFWFNPQQPSAVGATMRARVLGLNKIAECNNIFFPFPTVYYGRPGWTHQNSMIYHRRADLVGGAMLIQPYLIRRPPLINILLHSSRVDISHWRAQCCQMEIAFAIISTFFASKITFGIFE